MGVIFERFLVAATRWPDKVATEQGADRLTYGEVVDRVARLSKRLEATGLVSPKSRVGIESQGVDAFVAILAASSLDASVIAIGTGQDQVEGRRLAAAGATVLVRSGAALGETLSELDPDPSAKRGTSDEAFVVSTSGSTGTPKDVPVPGSGLAVYGDHLASVGRTVSDDRIAQVYEPAFDAYFEVVLTALNVGATMVFPKGREANLVSRFVAEHGVTSWNSVPSQLRLAHRMGFLASRSLSSLRTLVVGGEALTPDVLRLLRAAAPNATIINACGPTEMTIAVADFSMAPGDGDPVRYARVPIGSVYASVDHLLVPHHSQPETFELYARGPHRFPGYLVPARDEGNFYRGESRDELRPVTGTIEPQDWFRTGDLVRHSDLGLVHLGRGDRVTKLLGKRVDLGTVEAALAAHPDVGGVVAMAMEDRVHVVVEATASPHPDLSPLLAGLRPYARPASVTWVESIPALDNGKTDLAAVRELVRRHQRSSRDD